LMLINMRSVVNVVVDNFVFVTSFVVLLVSVFALVLWRRKKQTNRSEPIDDEFLVVDTQPRSKKTAKSKPKKTKSDKVFYCFLRCPHSQSINIGMPERMPLTKIHELDLSTI